MHNVTMKNDASIAASLVRVSGVNQMIVLPVIDNAVLKAVLALVLVTKADGVVVVTCHILGVLRVGACVPH
jgi:hypothetical protein